MVKNQKKRQRLEKEPQIFRSHERRAHFRFSVIGPLLAAPAARGQLQEQLQELAAKEWRHPITGQRLLLGRSTMERWYYKALHSKDGPVDVLKRKIRSDQGQHPALGLPLAQLLAKQYRQHPSWSCQLHADNLAVLVEQQSELGPMPASISVLRYMKSHGLFKRPRRGPVHSPGAQAAERRSEAREIRSYESEYVNALWHLDFHHGSLRVLLPKGQWVYPILLGISDDRSRLCCHAQWYLAQGALDLCHGLSQAFQKRQLPRSILLDNGSAMVAAQTQQGLTRLSILCERLSSRRELSVGLLTRPQAYWADFYREPGHLFGVPLSPHNRWNSSKVLREKWLAHIEASVYRPVLIIDEAQEMKSAILSELRLLSSADLDSRCILTIILAGDQRLASRLEDPLAPAHRQPHPQPPAPGSLDAQATPGMPEPLAQNRRQSQAPDGLAPGHSLRTCRRQPAPAHEYGQ